MILPILLLAFAPPQQAATVPRYWGTLERGRYVVGFDQRWIVDSARRLPAGPVRGPTYRPILMNVWYPATGGSRRPIAYRDFFDGALRAANAAPGVTSYAKALIDYQWTVVDNELTGTTRDSLPTDRRAAYERFLAAPTASVRAAPIAGRAYPVVVYFQGAGSSFDDNVALCEFLASRGYVVVGSAFPREDNQRFSTNAADGSRERDARRLLVEVRRALHVDATHVTVIGHSAGAQAALRFVADPSAPVDAVLSLDTTEDYWTLVDRRWAYFTDVVLERRREIKAPIAFLAEPRGLFELGDSLTAARRWYVTVPNVEHNDFIVQGVIRRELEATSDPKARAEALAARRSYDAIVRFIEAWLPAARSGQPVAPAAAGGVLSVVHVPVGEHEPASTDDPLSARAIRHLVSSAGVDAAVAAIRRARSVDRSAAAAQSDVAAALVKDLALRGDTAGARRFYEGLLGADTSYRAAFRMMTSLARYYDRIGERDEALPWWRTAAAMNPTDSVARRRIQPH